MTSFVPIPTESLMARDIFRMEEVLRALRQVLRDNEAAETFYVQDAFRGGGDTWMSQVTLTGERDWGTYYQYYEASRRDRFSTDIERASLQHIRGPQWTRFGTEDRLAWVRLLPALIQSLAGLDVRVTPDQSWRWDHREQPRPNGSARYVPRYQVMVSLGSTGAKPFDPEGVAQALLKGVATTSNPLADQHLFDWQQDLVGKKFFHQYGWSGTTLEAVFDTKALLEEGKKALFDGYECESRRLRPGDRKDTRWVLSVKMPA